MYYFKNIFVIAAIMLLIGVKDYAQDIITTAKGENITAKIEEIGLDVVKYRKFEHLDGPLYNLKKSEIASILYKNGDFTVFDEFVKKEKTSKSSELSKSESTNPLNYKGIHIIRSGNSYLFKGTKMSMDYQQFGDFLKIVCPKAHEMYEKGRNQYVVGVVFTTLGSVFLSTGTILMVCAHQNLYGYGYVWRQDLLISGAVLGGIGMVLGFPVGLTLLLNKKTERALELYNRNCVRYKSTASLSFDFSPNSFNLTLKF